MNSSRIALFVAAALGLVGAAVNWIYIDSKSRQFDKVELLSVAPGVTILPGDRFTEDKLAAMTIPKANLGQELNRQALRWSDRQTVVGMTAVYGFDAGEIILRQRLKTPPPSMDLAREDERGLPIPVDTRTFVPSLVNPGDTVSFVVGGMGPTPATANSGDNSEDSGFGGGGGQAPQSVLRGGPGTVRLETIGPFRVLSVGNRLGSADVLKASGMSQLQENVMTIAVKMQGDQLEPKAVKLLTLLQTGGFRQAGVLLHPRTNK